jgi:phosphosulfolactate synthase
MTNPLLLQHLPTRPAKPRQTGLTMVRDDGMPVAEMRDMLRSYGHMLDYMKFRQFVAWYMDPVELQEKIRACADAQVRTFVGGTVLEAAHLHGRTQEVLDAMSQLGLSAVEVSRSMVPLEVEQLVAVVRLAAAQGLEVLYEYGKKFQSSAFDVGEATRDIRTLLEAGAHRIIVERWQLDAVLGPKGENATASRLVELADAVGLESLVFEAETLDHQVWLIRELGPEVNLGPNIQPFHVPSKLEPFRHGIGSEVDYSIFPELILRTGADVPTLFVQQTGAGAIR